CRERNGQTASAWTHFRQAAAMARKSGERKREKYALSRARRLTGKLSYLVVSVPRDSRLPGLTITRNGEPLAEAAWNQETPIDPGLCKIVVEAPGYQRHLAEITVAPGAGQTEGVIPALRRATVPERPSPDSGSRASAGDGDGDGDARDGDAVAPLGDDRDDDGERVAPDYRDTDRRDRGMSGGRKAALVTGVLGVAMLANGAVFGVLAESKWSEAQDGPCDSDNRCTEEGVALVDDAKLRGTVANVSFATGAAVAVLSVVLWLSSSPSRAADENDSRAVFSPRLGPDQVGAAVTIRF
ncbi:MAG: hypothetical protein AAGC55_02240, partial [Myxococcota bacterium]